MRSASLVSVYIASWVEWTANLVVNCCDSGLHSNMRGSMDCIVPTVFAEGTSHLVYYDIWLHPWLEKAQVYFIWFLHPELFKTYRFLSEQSFSKTLTWKKEVLLSPFYNPSPSLKCSRNEKMVAILISLFLQQISFLALFTLELFT